MIELDDVSWWPVVECSGVRYAVAPRYVPAAAITDVLARQNGAELPSPTLVDAIWRAADVRVDFEDLVRTHDGSWAQMASPEVLADQAKRVDGAITIAWLGSSKLDTGERALLVAGTHKDVVRAERDYRDKRGILQLRAGALGIYGGHRRDGTVVQPPAGVHGKGYYDYSHGLRLVKRVAIAPDLAA